MHLNIPMVWIWHYLTSSSSSCLTWEWRYNIDLQTLELLLLHLILIFTTTSPDSAPPGSGPSLLCSAKSPWLPLNFGWIGCFLLVVFTGFDLVMVESQRCCCCVWLGCVDGKIEEMWDVWARFGDKYGQGDKAKLLFTCTLRLDTFHHGQKWGENI